MEFIPNVELSGRGGQPKNVFMLTCDAFGVLPPISRLTPAQAMYHFLSGYTAQVAGTEKGLGREPQGHVQHLLRLTLPAAPTRGLRPDAADLIARHGATCWLVNTGWSGGPYGVGKRMSIKHTRALLRAALDGSLANGVPQGAVLRPGDPRARAGHSRTRCWTRGSPGPTKAAYDRMAKHLIERFEANFTTYEAGVGADVKAVAIRAAA